MTLFEKIFGIAGAVCTAIAAIISWVNKDKESK